MGCIEELAAALGSAMRCGDEAGARYCSDMSGTGGSVPLAVICPRSTEEVSAVLRICHRHGQAVVPQGGMTGLAGGGNPAPGDIVLSLERLSGVEEIDTASALMTVRAGTPLEVAQEAARDKGLMLALDLGSRGSCQIGGNLATNAGGIRVIRYGVAREQVLGLEAVLADGTVVSSMNRMIKNNTGLDLKHLFIGTEGTLGVITRAVLRLHPDPGPVTTALCAATTFDRVIAFLRHARSCLAGLMAFEVMWQDYYRITAGTMSERFFAEDWPFWIIVEHTSSAHLQDCLAAALEQGLIADSVIAQSQAQARAFWAVREGLAIERFPNLLNFDVSLSIALIGDFADRCAARLRTRFPAAHVSFYGHIGDGNVHICVSTAYRDGEGPHDIDAIVYAAVRDMNGAISAEHGIGTLKRAYLGYTRSPAELAVMRAVKQALDPAQILNRGKLL
jgi:FAD/FMN-containing dehydrogenase